MSLRECNADATYAHPGSDSPALTNADTLTDGSADDNDVKEELFDTQRRLTTATTTIADLTAHVQDLRKHLAEPYDRATAAEKRIDSTAQSLSLPEQDGVAEFRRLLHAAETSNQKLKTDLEASGATVAGRDQKILNMAEKHEDLHRKHFAMLKNAKQEKADLECRCKGATLLQTKNEKLKTSLKESQATVRAQKAEMSRSADSLSELQLKHFTMLENAKLVKTDLERRCKGATFLQAKNEDLQYEKDELHEELKAAKRDFQK